MTRSERERLAVVETKVSGIENWTGSADKRFDKIDAKLDGLSAAKVQEQAEATVQAKEDEAADIRRQRIRTVIWNLAYVVLGGAATGAADHFFLIHP